MQGISGKVASGPRKTILGGKLYSAKLSRHLSLISLDYLYLLLLTSRMQGISGKVASGPRKTILGGKLYSAKLPRHLSLISLDYLYLLLLTSISYIK
jgi:hypothetical protein